MKINEIKWIWQAPDWPRFSWDNLAVLPLLQEVRLKQGVLLGKVGTLPNQESQAAILETLLQNIITSSAIEGERLNVKSVRSSLAKRLGIPMPGSAELSNRAEGLAKMMFDALNNVDTPFTLERLFQWHGWIFPEDKFTIYSVKVGALRGDEPMQVVSGRIDKPIIHFEAPPRNILEKELNAFMQWFNESHHDLTIDPLLRAAICHFWFVTVHPLEDGNGRITRALTDLALAQADKLSIRLYAMSPSILAKRMEYYHVLEQVSRQAHADLTPWLVWFLKTLDSAIQSSLDIIERTLAKTRFWQRFCDLDLSVEQRKVLNRLLEGGERGFEQGISASQYQKVTKLSKATATKHLSDLLEKGCIKKLPGGGRSTRYQINWV